VRSLLGSDIFPRGDKVDELASPLHRLTVHSRLPRGQGLPVRHHLILSRWWSAMFVRGKEASGALLLIGDFVLIGTCPWNIT
jgi:hypothetical protein